MIEKSKSLMSNHWVLLSIVLLLWGSFAAVAKLTMQGIDSFQLKLFMFGSSFVILTLWQIFRGTLKNTLRIGGKELLIVLLCGLPFWLYNFLYILSLQLIPAVEASMLNYLFPIMIVLFAIPINKEKLTWPNAVSILLGFAGAVVILTKGKFNSISLTNLAGDALAIGAAMCWGLFSNLGRWNSLDMKASIYFYVTESFILSIVAVACFSSFVVPDLLPVAGSVWVGLSNVVLSLPLWLKAMKTAPTTIVASTAFITPFITLLFILVLTGEPMSLVQGIGLLIIIAAIAVQMVKIKPKSKSV